MCINASKTLQVNTIKSKSGAIEFGDSICIDVSKTLLVETIKSKSGGMVTIDDSANITQSLFFATAGGTATGLNYYEEITHKIIWTDVWATDQSVNIDIVRIGKIVSIHIPTFAATANASSSATLKSGSFIPLRFAPDDQAYFVVAVTDSGVGVRGTLFVKTSGDMELGLGQISPGPFASGGTAGLNKNIYITYVV